MSRIEPTVPRSKTLPHISNGTAENQMSRTSTSLAHPYGSCDGSKSVLYYSAETHKVLTSRNYHFLDPSDSILEPEQLLITPDDAVHEGEPRNNAWNITDAEAGLSGPSKRKCEDNVEGSSKCQMRGKKVDYGHLYDPFSDEEVMNAEELTNLLEGDDNQPTFNQAKHSLEWPEWDKAIQAELAQL